MTIEIKCPSCGYSPIKMARKLKLTVGCDESDKLAIQSLQADPSVFNQLRFFGLLGSDDGNVFCPECGVEFSVDQLKLMWQVCTTSRDVRMHVFRDELEGTGYATRLVARDRLNRWVEILEHEDFCPADARSIVQTIKAICRE